MRIAEEWNREEQREVSTKNTKDTKMEAPANPLE